MNKLFYLTLVALVTAALLAACTGPQNRVANNTADVRQGISDFSGTQQCRECSKIQTHLSSALASYSWRHHASASDQGYLTGRIYVGVTNNQPNHRNMYFMKVDQVNSGIFNSDVGVVLINADGGSQIMLKIEQPDGYQINPYRCAQSFSSCFWSDYFQLPTAVIQNAIDTGKPLTIDIGQVRSNTTNDGYKNKSELVLLGVRVEVKSEYLKTFRDELAYRGVQLPTR
jgi:hypothetical protein